jgi:16S rRNA (adenine1518-N6/adenine1519-N6)-dimethyltransferase
LVKPKKHLGQHFLKDDGIAQQIVESLTITTQAQKILEIGPGMGVLTQFLVQEPTFELALVEIDTESVAYLKKHYPTLKNQIYSEDFLKMDLSALYPDYFSIIGNFPYNISSQIFFKVLDYRSQVQEVVGMLQKEVAERLAANTRTKDYGILSVLLQAYYTVEYLFTVPPTVFYPEPKVQSAVVRLKRNTVEKLDCNEKMFFSLVKTAFQMRRKTLRNALKPIHNFKLIQDQPLFNKRAEELGVAEFVSIVQMLEEVKEG